MAYRPMEKTPNPYGTVRSVPYAGADSLKHQPKIPNGRQWRELIHKHETLAPPPGSRGEEGDGAVTVPACMVQCGVNESISNAKASRSITATRKKASTRAISSGNGRFCLVVTAG
jgi:hypothetical protein